MNKISIAEGLVRKNEKQYDFTLDSRFGEGGACTGEGNINMMLMEWLVILFKCLCNMRKASDIFGLSVICQEFHKDLLCSKMASSHQLNVEEMRG
jgi:hypothetical protein